ncbi:27098_t:CDS:2, partial [Gigaspora margarita]
SDFSLATNSVSEASLVPNINDNNSYKFFFTYEALQKTHENESVVNKNNPKKSNDKELKQDTLNKITIVLSKTSQPTTENNDKILQTN